MIEYIKRDDVNAVFDDFRIKYALLSMYGAEHILAKVKDVLDEIPAADVRKNVRGEWRYKKNWGVGWYVCSRCSFENNETYHYCPNCGADMRGEKNER